MSLKRSSVLLLACLLAVPCLAQPQVQLRNDTTICTGTSLLLLPNTIGNGLTYLWQNGQTTSSITVDTVGWYWVEVSNAQGSDRDSVYLNLRYPPQSVDLGPDTLLCPGDSILLDAYQDSVTYFWQDNSSNDFLWVDQPGTYAVIVGNACGISTDTISISPLLPPSPFTLGADMTLCEGRDTVLIGPNSAPFIQYQWQDSSTSPSFTVQEAGSYHLTIENQCGAERDTVEIAYLRPPAPFSLGGDTSLCQGASLLLSEPQADVQYRWQDGSSDSSFLATQGGNVWLELENQCGTERDTLFVQLLTIPTPVDLGPDSTICEGQGLLFNLAQPDAQYLWSDSSTLSIYTATEQGWHWGMAYNQCGAERDSVWLEVYPGPDPFLLGNDTIICAGTSLELSAQQREGSYLWSTGDTTPSIFVNNQGVYWVEVSNRCGLELDNILIETLLPPQTFSLGPDTTICWQVPLVMDASIGQPPVSYLWQDGSQDSLFAAIDPGTYSVWLENKCGTASDTLQVDTLSSPPFFDLGSDTTYCLEDFPFIASVEIIRSDLQVRWENGDQIPLRWVQDTGLVELEVSNRCGTTRSTRQISGADCECTVYLGNAFTPNNDGHNDTFGPIQHCEIRSSRFVIYNRWGERVFESFQIEQAWDGTHNGVPCPEGVYVWILEYTGAERENVFSVPMRGSVTLWR